MAREPRPAFPTKSDTTEEPQLKVVAEEDYVEKLIKKRKQTTQKVTFDVDIPLIKALKKLQLKYPQGFKKEFINSAIRAEIDRMYKREQTKRKPKESGTG